MASEDIAGTMNRATDETLNLSPYHFANRTLRLERGLYVIRERTGYDESKGNWQKSEYAADGCGE